MSAKYQYEGRKVDMKEEIVVDKKHFNLQLGEDFSGLWILNKQ